MLHVSATGCEASWRIHVRIHFDDFQSSKKNNNVWGEDTADNVLNMISNPFRSFHLGLLQLVYHKIAMLNLIEKMLPKHQILGVYSLIISLPHLTGRSHMAHENLTWAALLRITASLHHCIAARPPAERGSICPHATCSRFEMWSRRCYKWPSHGGVMTPVRNSCGNDCMIHLTNFDIIVWIIDIIYMERIGWSEVPFSIIQLLRVVSPCMRAAICMSLHYQDLVGFPWLKGKQQRDPMHVQHATGKIGGLQQ